MTERIQVNLTLFKQVNRALDLAAIETEKPKYQIAEIAIAKYLGIDLAALAAEIPPLPQSPEVKQ